VFSALGTKLVAQCIAVYQREATRLQLSHPMLKKKELMVASRAGARKRSSAGEGERKWIGLVMEKAIGHLGRIE